MNKTQIRSALTLKKELKLSAIKESFNTAYGKLLEEEIKSNFGENLDNIYSLLKTFKDSGKLIQLVNSLIKSVNSNQDFIFESSYPIQLFSKYFEYGFYDEIRFAWRNEKYKKINSSKEQLIREVEKEYSKLDSILVKMTASEFYNYLLSIGVDLEIKEVEKPRLPSTQINVKLL